MSQVKGTILNDRRVREVNALLGSASVRIITDGVIRHAAIIDDFDLALQRLHELVGYMDNTSEFDKMKEYTRFKSMDAAGVLARTGYL